MNKDKNPFPEIKIFDPVKIIKKVGHTILESVTIHQLSSHGEHFVHPLDEVFDSPPYTDNDALYNMNQLYFPED